MVHLPVMDRLNRRGARWLAGWTKRVWRRGTTDGILPLARPIGSSSVLSECMQTEARNGSGRHEAPDLRETPPRLSRGTPAFHRTDSPCLSRRCQPGTDSPDRSSRRTLHDSTHETNLQTRPNLSQLNHRSRPHFHSTPSQLLSTPHACATSCRLYTGRQGRW